MTSANRQGTPESAASAPVIVAGAGPVGMRCVEELQRLRPQQRIKLFSGEAFKPYDRVKLSQVLARDIRAPSVYSPLQATGAVELFDNCPIVALDRAARRVQDCTGLWHEYTKLVLALGSEPFIPQIPNAGQREVLYHHTVAQRSANDFHRLLRAGLAHDLLQQVSISEPAQKTGGL